MAPTIVGSAASLYDLDLRPFRRSVQEVRETYRQLKAEAGAAGARLPAPVPAQLPRGRSGGSTADPAAEAIKQAAKEADEALKAFERLEKQYQVNQRSAARLADSEIRAARAGGDHQRALQLIESELAKAGAGTQRYNNLLAQQASVLKQAAAASKGLSGRDVFQAVAGGVGGPLGGLLAAASPAGAIGAAVGLLTQGVGEAAKLGNQVVKVDRSFQGLAASAGQSGAEILAALRQASGGEIDDLSLKLAANRANLLGVATTAEDLSRLLAIARERSQALGTTTQEAFDDLVTGLGRGSPLILDNLGIVVKIGDANEAYAKKLGKTAAELTSVEQKQALINAVLSQAGTGANAAGDGLTRLNTTLTNVGQAAGEAVAPIINLAADGLERIIRAAQGSEEAIVQLRAALAGRDTYTQAEVDAEKLARAQEKINKGLERAQDLRAFKSFNNNAQQSQLGTFLGANDEFERTTKGLDELRERMVRLAAASPEAGDQIALFLDQFGRSGNIDLLRVGIEALERKQAGLTAGVPPYIAARQGATDAERAAAQASDGTAKSYGEQIKEAQQASVASQELEARKNALREAADRVTSGVSTEADEVKRLARLFPDLAGLAGPLIAQELQLAGAADAAAGALGRQRIELQRLQSEKNKTDQSGSIGFDSPGRRGTSDVDAVAATIRQQREEQAAAAGQIAQIERDAAFRRASDAEKLKTLNTELKRLAKGTVEYAQKQAEISDLEAQIADRRDASGARSVRSAETAYGKIEDRTEDHYRKLAQLQEDYQRSAARAQEDFETKRARDTEDFERRRQKLLAEGKRAEAKLLEEEFNRQQQRDREDFDRQRQRAAQDEATRVRRENTDLGVDVGRQQEKLGGASSVRGASSPAALAQPTAAPTASAAAAGGAVLPATIRAEILVRGEPQTVIVTLQGGQELARTIIPFVERKFLEDLELAAGATPATADANIAGGGRP